MKRSEFTKKVRGKLRASLMNPLLDFQNGDISMGVLLTKIIEETIEIYEEEGMLPPETTNLLDAEIIIQPSYFKEHVPQVFALGWDEE